MHSRCVICSESFELSDDELAHLARVSPVIAGVEHPLTLPDKCRDCRELERLAFRNERHLFHRTCDLTGRRIVTIFPPEAPYRVCSSEAWWSDSWSALEYGREIDFSRPFFEQFDELWRSVPQLGLFTSKMHNSEFSNFSESEKNCYLVFASNRNEDCLYSEYIWDSKNCVDCTNVERSERLYMCVECSQCTDSTFLHNCHSSYNLDHCFDCLGCHHLFACAGLRRSSFCILNEQFSEAEYYRRLADPGLRAAILARFEELKLRTPRRFALVLQCESVTGSNLRQCKNVIHGFDSFGIEDARYIDNSPGNCRDMLDISGSTGTELSYQLGSVANGYRVSFTLYSYQRLTHSCYTVLCQTSDNLFGCIGVRNAKNCILNRSYSAAEFERLSKRLVGHMRETGEWSRFIPPRLSPWGYNLTVAFERRELNQEQALARGYNWRIDRDTDHPSRPGNTVIGAADLPAKIDNPEQFFRDRAVLCADSGKPYRIIPQELAFYRSMNLPVPMLSPNRRFMQRRSLQTPKRLWLRDCDRGSLADREPKPSARCSNRCHSPYQAGGPELVYCESCYTAEMYN